MGRLSSPLSSATSTSTSGLSYIELNPSSPSTTLFIIHSASTSTSEYAKTLSFFPPGRRHVLLPFSPSFGPPTSPSSQLPFSLPSTAQHFISLIRERAHRDADGRPAVHVVGVSLGAHLGLYLASHLPDDISVESVFVSGFGNFEPAAYLPIMPYLLRTADVLEGLLIPKALRRALLDDKDLDYGEPAGTNASGSMATTRAMLDAIVVPSSLVPEFFANIPSPCRCLLVCATKRGWLATDDNVEKNRVVFGAIERNGGDGRNRLVSIRECRHPWHVLDPELFATCVLKWVDKAELDGCMEVV